MQELARIGNWEFDLVNDKIRWSEETFRIFGLPSGSQELDFADVLLAIDGEDRAGFDGAIQRAIAERQPYKLDLRIRPDCRFSGAAIRGTGALNAGDGPGLRTCGRAEPRE